MLFKIWATKLAGKLGGMAEKNDTYEIALIQYRLECVFSMTLSILVLVFLAVGLGILKTALLISLTGVIIKSFIGGLHLGTPLRCAIVGALLTIGFSYLAIYFPLSEFPGYLVWGLLLLLNIIVWGKAPRETREKPLSQTQKKYLRIFSRCLILILALICLVWPKGWGVNELFYGMIFQVLSILNVSALGMERLNNLAAKIERKPVF